VIHIEDLEVLAARFEQVRRLSESETVLLPIGEILRLVPLEVHGQAGYAIDALSQRRSMTPVFQGEANGGG